MDDVGGDISSQLDDAALNDTTTARDSINDPAPRTATTRTETASGSHAHALAPSLKDTNEVSHAGDDGDITLAAESENVATRPDASSYQAERSEDEDNGVEDDGAFEAVDLGAAQPRTSAEAADANAEVSPSPTESRSTTPPTTADASSSNLPSNDKASPPKFTHPFAGNGESSAPAIEAQSSPTKSPEISKQPRLSTSTPNKLQKLVSMTRQRNLPPKAREEEKKHLRELEEMRTAAKDAETRRQQALKNAAAARQTRIAQAFPTWEQAILPNWRVVLQEDANGKALKQMWWNGTMPTRWRGRLWGLCIGNGLAISKAAFSTHLIRARTAIDEGRYPPDVLAALERDVEDTLPTLKLYQKGGVMHDDLVDVLLAYIGYQASETMERPRYPSGLACPAAMLLVNMAPADAWVSLANLIHKSCLKSFYNADDEELEAYFRIFDTLLADSMPKIYENFSKEVVRPKLYLYPWLISLYVRFLPLDLSTRIFDVFLLEGDSFLFRIALSLLQILEPRLFNPDQSELAAVFDGTDRGAVLIVKRQKQVYGEEEVSVEVEEVYTEMGCTEAAIFGCLEALDWREETYQRLAARELPEMD